MKRFFLRLLLLCFILLFGLGMGVAGWFFGFRDGNSLAFSDMGDKLPVYFRRIPDNDPAKTKKFLDLYTAGIVCHLLNVHHRFPLFIVQPYKARGALMDLRAVWHPDESVFEAIAPTLVQYPMETPQADYFAAWQAVQPMKPGTTTPPAYSQSGTN